MKGPNRMSELASGATLLPSELAELNSEPPDETEAADERIGQVLDGRYRITSRLGEGGMGLVYEATHVVLKNRVALKILRPDASDHESIERLKREAQAASAIGHPHIVDVRDFGALSDGSTYVVMELIEGDNLFTEVKRGPIPWRRAQHIAIQVAEGLAAAHQAKIVHRDLKPENILLTSREGRADFVKLVDFGIARMQGASKLTAAGRVVGTPEYMAPEQCAGIEVDHRADIYALGILLYEMITRKLPLHSRDLVEMLRKQIKEKPKPPSEVAPDIEIPEALEAIILRCLEKRPSRRFKTMADVADALRTLSPEAGVAPAVDADEPDPFASLSDTPAPSHIAAPSPLQTQTPQGITVPPAPNTMRWVALGLAVFGLAAGVSAVLVAWMGRGSSDPPANHASFAADSPLAAAPSQSAALPPTGSEPVAESDTTPAETPTEASPSAATAPEEAPRVLIESVPSGARIYRDGTLLGETPFSLERPAQGERLELRLSHPGFRDSQITLGALASDHVTLHLEARPSPAASPEVEPEPAPPEPAPEAAPAEPAQTHPRGHRPGFMNPWD